MTVKLFKIPVDMLMFCNFINCVILSYLFRLITLSSHSKNYIIHNFGPLPSSWTDTKYRFRAYCDILTKKDSGIKTVVKFIMHPPFKNLSSLTIKYFDYNKALEDMGRDVECVRLNTTFQICANEIDK